MKIASWNMNGYSARVKDGSLAALLRQRFDVVCLQETKLGSKPLPEMVADFHAAWSCAEGGRHHGVAILSKEAPLSVRTSGVPEVDGEGRILAVELKSLWVASVYSPTFVGRPEREAYRFRYEDDLRRFAVELLSSGKHVVLCGDLNVTAQDVDCHQAPLYAGTPNHTAREREAFASLIDLGLVDAWRRQHPQELWYSWMPVVSTPLALRREVNAGFRFDYVLASSGLDVISTDILVAHPGSDHVPVTAVVKI